MKNIYDHFQLNFYVTAACITQLYAELCQMNSFLTQIHSVKLFRTLPDFSNFLPSIIDYDLSTSAYSIGFPFSFFLFLSLSFLLWLELILHGS
jgi:hypothetical protein